MNEMNENIEIIDLANKDEISVELPNLKANTEIVKSDSAENEVYINNLKSVSSKIEDGYKEISFNGRTLHIRKWKVFDKKSLDKATNLIQKRFALVYNCIKENDVVLDMEEYTYVLSCIRDYSIHEPLALEFNCTKCNGEVQEFYDIEDCLSVSGSSDFTITTECMKFVLGKVDNKEYEYMVSSSITSLEKYLYDFIYHVKSYTVNDKTYTVNDNESIESLKVILENLDVDVFDSIYREFETSKFKAYTLVYCDCPHCQKEHLFSFTDLSDFFPKSWKI